MGTLLRALGLVIAGSVGTTPAWTAGAPPWLQSEDAEERYSFLVGLCEAKQWDLAVREARAFLAAHPSHARAALARYRLATALFESGDRAAARDEFAQLAGRAQFEFRAECLFRLGQCELALGRHDEAARRFAAVIETGGYLAPPARFFLAETDFARGDFAAAERGYAAVLADEQSAEYARDARYGRAWCALRTQRWDDVVARADEFLQRHRDDPDADEMRYLAGEGCLGAGRADQALERFDSVRSGAFRERALRGAGFACVALSRHAEAARRFERLLRESPDSEFASEARLQLGVARVNANDARGAVDALTGEAQRDPHAAYWLARAHRELGDHAAALASVERAESLAPPGELAERLRLLRGELLSAMGREDEAARVFAGGSTSYSRYAAAVSAFNAGDLPQAARLAREALKAAPGEHTAELQLIAGEGELAAGRLAEALQCFDAAASSDKPDTARRARSRAAWTRFANGDHASAARGFEELVASAPNAGDSNFARYMLGRCRERIGDASGAVEAWREYVRRDARGEHAAEALAGLARLDAERSAEWAQRLVRDFPDERAAIGASIDLADRDAREGRRERAIERYRAVLERAPDHPDAAAARYGLAWALFESGSHAECAREVAQLLASRELAPALRTSALELDVWAKAKLGDGAALQGAFAEFAASDAASERKLAAAREAATALEALGETERARAVFDELLPRTRDRVAQAAVLVESSFLALDADDVDEAEARVRAAWKIAPQDGDRSRVAEASFFVAEARFESGDDERAAELYQRATSAANGELLPAALYKLGFVALRNGRLDEAAASFERVANEAPKHELAGESLQLAGEAHARAGRFERAFDLTQRMVKEHPRHASVDKALFRLGVAAGELGRWDECSRALAELARRAPKFEAAAEAELWRGRAAYAASDVRAATAAFERACAADKGRIAALARIELGKLASAAGRHEDALAHYLKVALLYEKSDVEAEASLGAASALEALGQLDRARERYRAVVADHAGEPYARRAQERLRALDVR